MSENAEDLLLELARAVSDRLEPERPEALEQLADEDRETAAVLVALGRLFEAGDSASGAEGHSSLVSWGPFELVARVGDGSFGQVYRARDRRLERDVALKLYRAPKGAAKEGEIWREGRLLARVRHPHVASVFGVEEHDGQIGIVMELVEGQDFGSLVAERGPLSAREAALTGVDVCRALAALHHARVLHRDVKAENVLREAGGRTVLVDLGIGLEVGERGAPMGTPLYLAPELFEGGEPSPRSDLYSLGVLLFFLVSGRFPCEAETIEELREAHRSGRRLTLRDARPDVPWSFARLIEDCLCPDPRERPVSAGDLERRLIEILDPGKVVEKSRRRWPPVVLASGLALALGGLGWLVAERAKDAPSRRLVIGEIANQTGERLFDHGPREALRLGLENARGLELLPREREREALGRMTLAPETPLAGEVGRELCRREGYEVFLEGSLERRSEGWQLRLEGLDCRDGERRFEERRRFADRAGLTAAVGALVGELRRQLGELEIDAGASLAEATTPSLEALAFFSEGLEHQRAGDLMTARELFEAAIEEDPEFALAHAQLATCRNGLGDLPGALQAAEAAFEFRHRASERERNRIAVMYHLDRLQYREALEPARRLAALYPRDAEARRQLAHLYARLGRLSDAVAAAREAVELSPGLLPRGVLAGYLGQAGRFDEALEVCREARRVSGDGPSYLDWVEGMIHLDRGDLASAQESFERLARVGSIYSEASAHLLVLTEVLGGRYEAARRRLAVNSATNPESRYWTARDRRLAAGLALVAGESRTFERELAFLGGLATLPIHLRDLRAAALLWAAFGSAEHLGEIARRLGEIDEHYPSAISRAARLQIEAELASLTGDLETARDRLATARRVWRGDAALLLSELRLAEAAGDAGEARRLRRLLVEERKTEMLDLGYGLEWRLLQEVYADMGEMWGKPPDGSVP